MAIRSLAPAGRLVYSTCSLEPEENEDVIAEMLRSDKAIHREPAGETASVLAGHLSSGAAAGQLFDAAGQFRTFPAEQPTDGFFAAVLAKV